LAYTGLSGYDTVITNVFTERVNTDADCVVL